MSNALLKKGTREAYKTWTHRTVLGLTCGSMSRTKRAVSVSPTTPSPVTLPPTRRQRQHQGTRALLEAPLMAWRHQAHLRQRCLRPSALGDVCLTTLGLEVPILAALPRLHNSPLAKCGCKKFGMDFHGDHTSTCTAHSGATKAHDWMVSVLGPLFRIAGHVVRTQHGVTASVGQRRGDVEIRNYLRDQAGSRSLVFDLSIAHDRFGSLSSHP
jgi:hypothetical protein